MPSDAHATLQKRIIATAAAAVCSLLTACGGGGSSENEIVSKSQATTPPSTSETRPTVLASAGEEKISEQGVDVILEGSGTAQHVDGAPPKLSYSWTQVGGPAVDLTDDRSPNPMFKTPFVTATSVMTFALTVSAATLPTPVSASDKVRVTVNLDSPWGVAPSAALSYNPGVWLPSMVDAGVTSVRGFHAPAPPAPAGFAPIAAANMSGVGILQWSSGPTLTFPVNDLEGWRRYVTAQVTRFKGQVKYWEVWNEPPNFTANASPASYAKLVAVAFDAAKAVDPAVQIGLAAKSNHVAFLSEAIVAGAKDKFDFVTLHPYEVASMLPSGWEGRFMGMVPTVRKMLSVTNAAKSAVPVWFTEIGIPASTADGSGVGPNVQADVLTKIYTMAIAQGAARTYWFDPMDSEGLAHGLTTSDGTRRPAWYALRSLTRILGKSPVYLGWAQTDGAYYGFLFKTETGVAMIAWTRKDQSTTRSLLSDVAALDPRTGTQFTTRSPTITDAPTVLLAQKDSAQAHHWTAEVAANASKAFPWNGDHSAAKSVELIAGELPNGVFMVNAPAVTVVDGIPQFNFNGRGSVSFAVDPTFLSYDPTPIRITAVVRGQGEGDPGFNLKYESDVPIHSTDSNGLVGAGGGWFQIRGTKFFEKTWTIPNARFVGMYGYNFTFDTDGYAHSQFSIAKVTVSK